MSHETKLLYAAIDVADLVLAESALSRGASVDGDGHNTGPPTVPGAGGHLTALSFAIQKERIDIAMLLLDRGADVNLGDCSPLRHAVRRSDTELVAALAARGADLNDETSSSSLVGDAVSGYGVGKKGSVEMVRLLASLGVDLDDGGRGNYSDPPIVRAVEDGDADLVRVLAGELGKRGGSCHPLTASHHRSWCYG